MSDFVLQHLELLLFVEHAIAMERARQPVGEVAAQRTEIQCLCADCCGFSHPTFDEETGSQDDSHELSFRGLTQLLRNPRKLGQVAVDSLNISAQQQFFAAVNQSQEDLRF